MKNKKQLLETCSLQVLLTSTLKYNSDDIVKDLYGNLQGAAAAA